MSQSRWLTRGTLGSMGIAAAVALLAGCGSTGTPAPAGSSGPTSSTATSTTTTASSATTSTLPDPDAPIAQKLCDEIKPQLSDWRVQGPTIGGAALNIAVHEWALRNGGLAMNARVLGDKAMIDRITTKTCPDVRTDALQALNLQSFAAGILG
ncbi:hypothetical protein [Nocardia macrotermitis]|uniref:Lipoprotein n=1 Tax=Nocardia macrotermitis TaxID=2585198 RepID=A0A7K0DHH4_9NOCA|nr:hypothetical protein [Nocardia macrotermitis]MQY24244.1 hypothetical protein [Nocardia macrotermitis]